LRKAKNGKAVGKDGYPMEFSEEIIKNEEISKMITEIMNKIYETGNFPIAWKTSLLHLIYLYIKVQGTGKMWVTIRI
jgi:hypothetical protein